MGQFLMRSIYVSLLTAFKSISPVCSFVCMNQNLNPSFMKLDSVDPWDDPANDCITMIIKVCCIMFIFDHAS